MDESEFTIHLFSNSSMDVYPSNSLTKFTVNLSSPLYLNSFYKVALSEISLPAPFNSKKKSLSRDRIVFDDLEYTKMYPVQTFKTFISCILRVCATSVTEYTRDYFNEYLDKEIFFDPYTFPKIFANDVTSILHPDNTAEFPLEIHELMFEDPGRLTPSDYIPPEHFGSFVHYWMNSYVRLSKKQAYTLKQILNACVVKIFNKTRVELQNFTDLYKVLDEEYKTIEEKEEIIYNMRNNSDHMIRRFIERFVSTVETIRNEILLERKITVQDNENFIFVYADIVRESYLSNIKARILSVFPKSTDGESVHIKQDILNYEAVDRSIINSISIIVSDEFGSLLNLAPSLSPTHIVLKFRREEMNL